MSVKSAAEVAIELYHEPRLAQKLVKVPLHRDVLSVIKVVAGDAAALHAFPDAIASKPDLARQISSLYILKVLFHDRHNDNRLLGLNPGADVNLVKDHKRWLLKWLHPDRNANKWEQAYFKPVADAAKRLEVAGATVTAASSPNTQHRGRRVSNPHWRKTQWSKPGLHPVGVAVPAKRRTKWIRYATAVAATLMLGIIGMQSFSSLPHAENTLDAIASFITGN